MSSTKKFSDQWWVEPIKIMRYQLNMKCFGILFSVVVGSAVPLVAQNSLYSDVKAKRIGDIITVVLKESSQGSSTTDNRSSASGSTDARGSISGNFMPFEPLFGADVQVQNGSEATNLATQRQLLEGFLSVQIIEVTPYGDLIVKGNRITEVNGEIHEMSISGTVRQNDIDGNNQVLSYRIANASISYQKKGGLSNKTRSKRLGTKILTVGVTAGLAAVAVLEALKLQN
jgi:flagellar L-ring protein precursor FlgH